MESWRSIDGYEGLYEVSDLGKVRSLNYRMSGVVKIRPQKTDRKGYKAITLCKNQKMKTFRVHRLVAKAFVTNLENKPEVNHRNEIKDDNRASNLEWMTRLENIHHGTGIMRHAKILSISIKQLTLDGELVKVWESSAEAGRNGFDNSSICKSCLGRYGFKTYRGFKWEYA